MVMAYWNGMQWTVSGQQISYLESLSTSFGIETQTNTDKDGNAASETVARKLIEISLDTTYMVETGTRDVRGVINQWNGLIGKTSPFVLGNQTFGPSKVQLMSVNVSDVRLSPNGVMMAAKLAFKFREYKEPEKKAASTVSAVSAVKIGATKNDKKTKKPVSIKVPTLNTKFKDKYVASVLK